MFFLFIPSPAEVNLGSGVGKLVETHRISGGNLGAARKGWKL